VNVEFSRARSVRVQQCSQRATTGFCSLEVATPIIAAESENPLSVSCQPRSPASLTVAAEAREAQIPRSTCPSWKYRPGETLLTQLSPSTSRRDTAADYVRSAKGSDRTVTTNSSFRCGAISRMSRPVSHSDSEAQNVNDVSVLRELEKIRVQRGLRETCSTSRRRCGRSHREMPRLPRRSATSRLALSYNTTAFVSSNVKSIPTKLWCNERKRRISASTIDSELRRSRQQSADASR